MTALWREAELAAAFGRLFRDPELMRSLGRAGRERVLKYYRLERTVDAYYRLYRKLTGL